jgi:hypothetical protein
MCHSFLMHPSVWTPHARPCNVAFPCPCLPRWPGCDASSLGALPVPRKKVYGSEGVQSRYLIK